MVGALGPVAPHPGDRASRGSRRHRARVDRRRDALPVDGGIRRLARNRLAATVEAGAGMSPVDTCLLFIDEAIDGMVEIVNDLGDHLANVRPDLADANSAFVLLT